jgi:hypothetical protein
VNGFDLKFLGAGHDGFSVFLSAHKILQLFRFLLEVRGSKNRMVRMLLRLLPLLGSGINTYTMQPNNARRMGAEKRKGNPLNFS